MRNRLIVIFFTFIFSVIIYNLSVDILKYFSHVPGYSLVNNINFYDMLPYIIVSIIPAFFININYKKSSDLILWFVYYTHVVPSVILHPLIVIKYTFLWSYILILFFTVTVLLNKIKFNKNVSVNISFNKFNMILIFISMFFISVLIVTFGINLNLPDITDVYGLRREYVEKSNLLSGYIAIMGGYVVAPFLLLYGIVTFKINKKISLLFIVLSIFLSFQIFANSGFKSVAFSSIISLLLFLYLRIVFNFGFSFSISIPIFILFIIFISDIFNLEIVLYHWFRRTFIDTGINVNFFYEYISQRNLLYLDNAPNIISNYYYNTNGSANSGLLGDSFARLNYFGFFINGFIFLIVLKVSDKITSNINNKNFVMSLFLPTSYAISNSSITTIFLTYGFLLLIVLLVLSKNSLNCID